ncbi:flap endonuclease-1 [Candidatus Woesearchaeota archaeon]|nr:flap endonuclease-1 [Candidatus Woesearchaeota archaeon]
MGIALKELISGKEVDIKMLTGKIICIDAPMILYQFLTTIRQADGSYFTDQNGNVTSHLIGINSRIGKLLQYGLRLVFVFDGKPPELKAQEIERRKEGKKEAETKYKIAMERKDFSEMRKYASRNVKVTKDIIEETKELVDAFGIPIIEAPSEAEAQASHMVKKGDAYAVATQDADTLMFGCPRVLKNLSLVGKHKKNNKLDYQTYKPELIELSEVLNELGVDHEQFVLLSILIGTDFNPGGIKGIGPKNALKLVKEYRNKERLIESLKDKIEFDFEEVYRTVKNVPVTDDYQLEWKKVDQKRINGLLVEKHNFSEERVKKILDQLTEQTEAKKQTSLGAFI